MQECFPKHFRMGTATMKSREEGATIKYGAHKTSRRPNYSSGLLSPKGRYSPTQWMNYLTNIIYTYNPSTTPRKRSIQLKNTIH